MDDRVDGCWIAGGWRVVEKVGRNGGKMVSDDNCLGESFGSLVGSWKSVVEDGNEKAFGVGALYSYS